MQLETPSSRHRRSIVRRSWTRRAPATTRMDGGAHPCTARCRTLSPSPCKATLFLFLFQPIHLSFAQSSNALRAGQTVFHSFQTRPVTEFVGNRVYRFRESKLSSLKDERKATGVVLFRLLTILKKSSCSYSNSKDAYVKLKFGAGKPSILKVNAKNFGII